MVNFDIAGTHKLIILNIDGKTPLRVSSGSVMFHNANDLLCCALAACIGNNLKRFCMWEEIDPRLFETIIVQLNNSILEVIISCPKDFPEDKKLIIKRDLSDCSVAKLLKDPVAVSFKDNDIPTTTLVEDKPKSCCGG